MFSRAVVVFGAFCVINGVGVHSGSATAQTNVVAAISAQCKALASADFSDIQDAPTQVTAAKLVEAGVQYQPIVRSRATLRRK